jgi:hypothetical protein
MIPAAQQQQAAAAHPICLLTWSVKAIITLCTVFYAGVLRPASTFCFLQVMLLLQARRRPDLQTQLRFLQDHTAFSSAVDNSGNPAW